MHQMIGAGGAKVKHSKDWSIINADGQHHFEGMPDYVLHQVLRRVALFAA